MYRIELPGSRIYLRPVELTDAFTVVKWRNTADSRRAFFDRRVVTPDTHADFIQNRSKHDLVWMALTVKHATIGFVDDVIATPPGDPVGMTSVTIHDVNGLDNYRFYPFAGIISTRGRHEAKHSKKSQRRHV